jgi:hypothetical protein
MSYISTHAHTTPPSIYTPLKKKERKEKETRLNLFIHKQTSHAGTSSDAHYSHSQSVYELHYRHG